MTEHLILPDDNGQFAPCGRCGHSPADHLGWAQGHLYLRRMSYQTAQRVAEVEDTLTALGPEGRAHALEAANAVLAAHDGTLPTGPCPQCGGAWGEKHKEANTCPAPGALPPAEVQPHGAGATATPECCPPGTDLHTPAADQDPDVDFRPAGYLATIHADHRRTAATGHGPEDYPDPRTDPQTWVDNRWAELAAMSSHEVDAIYRSVTRTEAPPEWIKAQVIGAILDHEWAARTRPRAVFHSAPTPPETEPGTARCRSGHLWDEECPECS